MTCEFLPGLQHHAARSTIPLIRFFLVYPRPPNSQVGDIVLAKIKGFPAWPGIVSCYIALHCGDLCYHSDSPADWPCYLST